MSAFRGLPTPAKTCQVWCPVNTSLSGGNRHLVIKWANDATVCRLVGQNRPAPAHAHSRFRRPDAGADGPDGGRDRRGHRDPARRLRALPGRPGAVALGFFDDDADHADTFFAYHSLHTWVADGQNWTSPRVRVYVGGAPEETVLACRQANRIDGYPSLAEKLGAGAGLHGL